MDSGSLEYPWIVKRDIDGFFGLAIDNLIQFLLIATLCPIICGIPSEFVFTRIMKAFDVSKFVWLLAHGNYC